jgi:hypothetical protein
MINYEVKIVSRRVGLLKAGQKEIRENENYFLIHAESGNEAVPPQSTLFEALLGGRSYCMRNYGNYEGGIGEDRLLICFKA